MLFLASSNRRTIELETWLLGLKVKRPDLFANIRDKKENAHLEARELLNGLQPDQNMSHIISALSDIHDRYQRDDFEGLTPDEEHILGRACINHRDILPAAIRRLETFN